MKKQVVKSPGVGISMDRSFSSFSQSKASPETKSIRSFRTTFKRNAQTSALASADKNSSIHEEEHAKTAAVVIPEHEFKDDLKEVDIQRLRIWKEAEKKRKRLLEA